MISDPKYPVPANKAPELFAMYLNNVEECIAPRSFEFTFAKALSDWPVFDVGCKSSRCRRLRERETNIPGCLPKIGCACRR